VVRYDLDLWARCIVAWLITLALIEVLVQLVGPGETTEPLLGWYRIAFVSTVLWFFFGPVWSLATAWRRAG